MKTPGNLLMVADSEQESRGVRIEDVVLVNAKGPRDLTQFETVLEI